MTSNEPAHDLMKEMEVVSSVHPCVGIVMGAVEAISAYHTKEALSLTPVEDRQALLLFSSNLLGAAAMRFRRQAESLIETPPSGPVEN